jgi:hypothetical protein
LPGIWVQSRAYWATARERLRHARALASRHRHVLVSAALVVLGLGGALAGGALIGEWALGLVLIAESACVAYVGLRRDDRVPLPRAGERTVGEVLEAERRRPW